MALCHFLVTGQGGSVLRIFRCFHYRLVSVNKRKQGERNHAQDRKDAYGKPHGVYSFFVPFFHTKLTYHTKMDFSTKKFLHSPAMFFAALFLLGWFGVQFWGVAQKMYALYRERKLLEAELASLQHKKAELEAGLLRFQSESYLEREAKRRLNLKKIGERAVVIVPEEKKEVAATSPSFWQRVRVFIPFLFR